MSEGAQCSYQCGTQELVFFILDIELFLEQFVESKLRCMRWNAATCNNLSSFPESVESLLSIKQLCSSYEC